MYIVGHLLSSKPVVVLLGIIIVLAKFRWHNWSLYGNEHSKRGRVSLLGHEILQTCESAQEKDKDKAEEKARERLEDGDG